MEAIDARAALTPPQENPTFVNDNIASLREGENGKFVLSLKGAKSTCEISNISPDENTVLKLLVENRNKPELPPATVEALTENATKYLKGSQGNPEIFVKNNLRSLRDKLDPYGWKITNINQKKAIKGAYILEENFDQEELKLEIPKLETNSHFDTSLLLPIPSTENTNISREQAEINAAILILDLINRGLFNQHVPLYRLAARAFGDKDKLMERILGNENNLKKIFLMYALRSNLDRFWIPNRRSSKSIPSEHQGIIELCGSLRKKGYDKKLVLETLSQQLLK